MKDLLSKGQYYFKICTSSMESNAPPSFKKPFFPIWITPTFLQENLDPSFYDFSNISAPYK